jgi:hypothetical protein
MSLYVISYFVDAVITVITWCKQCLLLCGPEFQKQLTQDFLEDGDCDMFSVCVTATR